MRRTTVALAVMLVSMALMSATVQSRVESQAVNRAVVVVRFEDDRSESRCVAFDELEISGTELLQRSGLATELRSSSQGGLVCAIEGVGCGAGDCLCQCKSEPCVYWSYWQSSDEGWSYSPIGASVRRVSHGEVDGWSWGPGSITSAIEPPPVTFGEVCSDDAVLFGISNGEPAEVSAMNRVDWITYGTFALLVAVLGAVTLVVSKRRRAK